MSLRLTARTKRRLRRRRRRVRLAFLCERDISLRRDDRHVAGRRALLLREHLGPYSIRLPSDSVRAEALGFCKRAEAQRGGL